MIDARRWRDCGDAPTIFPIRWGGQSLQRAYEQRQRYHSHHVALGEDVEKGKRL